MDRLARERHTQLMVKSKSQRRAPPRTDKQIHGYRGHTWWMPEWRWVIAENRQGEFRGTNLQLYKK